MADIVLADRARTEACVLEYYNFLSTYRALDSESATVHDVLLHMEANGYITEFLSESMQNITPATAAAGGKKTSFLYLTFHSCKKTRS